MCIRDRCPTPLDDQIPAAFNAFVAGYWHFLRSNFTDWQLFVVGNWLCFTSAFWLMGAIFAIIDYSRPANIVPFRMQPDTWPTWREYKRAAALSLLSSVIFFFLFWGLYFRLSSVIFFFLFWGFYFLFWRVVFLF